MIKKVIAAFVFVMLLPVAVFAGVLDSSFRFSTISTRNFTIHFHQGLEDAARRTAVIAEEVYGPMSELFSWHPEEKTQLLLVDNSDFANGMTTVLPYNSILLQMVPPAFDSTIGEYDDWLRTLIIHEFAHVLTLDPSRGYSRITRSIFGKPVPQGDIFSLLEFIATAPPNIFLPVWWHEGMATWAETAFTNRGRGRSRYYDMIFRMAVAEDNIPTIDRINGNYPYWPHGHMPYIFGLRLAAYIGAKGEGKALGTLNSAHAGRFPYFLNAPAQSLFNGRDYVALYRDMVQELKQEQEARIRVLQQIPLSATKILKLDGENLTNPRISPDGRTVAFNREDPNGHAEILFADPDSSKVIGRVRRLYSDGRISWAPDSGSIYFSQAEVVRGFNVYQDLYRYEIANGNIRRLTRGERIGEPEISPDGKNFAFVQSSRGSQNLAILAAVVPEAGKGKIRTVTGYTGERVSHPSWSPDSSSIAYLHRDNRGRSSLCLYDQKSGSQRELFSGEYSIASPVWTRDGKNLLYISDETGVYNVFAFSLESGSRKQVSHLLGGTLSFDLAPDGSRAILSEYTSRGSRLASISIDPSEWRANIGPSIASVWPLPEKTQLVNPDIAGHEDPAKLEVSSYSSFRTLLPRFWLPVLKQDGNDNVQAGAFTAGQDALGYHSYQAELAYGFKYQKMYGSFLYQNEMAYPSFNFLGYIAPFTYTEYLNGDDDYDEVNRGVKAGFSIPYNNLESAWSLGLGYHLQEQKALSPLAHGRFEGKPVFEGRRDNLYLQLDYSGALKYPLSISHEEGRFVSLQYRVYRKDVGADLNASEFTGSWEEYIRVPFPFRPLPHHVLYLKGSGGQSWGERIPQQAFQLGGIASLFNQFSLRGYPSRFEAGDSIVTATAELRTPFWYLLKGIRTMPLYFDRLHGAIFCDAGQVWGDRSFKGENIKVGAGVEVRFDMTLGYRLSITPLIGFAHGFNDGGESRVYFNITSNL